MRVLQQRYAAPLPTALVAVETTLETLFDAHLLCDICEERPWTTTGRWHPNALLCADCRMDEPNPFEEGD
jgi:hypothetical protein